MTRPLPFPLQHPLVVVGDTPDDGTPTMPFTWATTDDDEKVIISLELSFNEYQALSAAIDVGRDISHGVDTNWIWWLWVRSVNTMEFCARVIECIENNP